jgi:hypothetical protein
MNDFVSEQLWVTTAELESMLFNEDKSDFERDDSLSILPSGVYRVICGELFRIVYGVPPELGKE